MDSDTGGQFSSDLSRQAAAQIARRKVLAAYANAAQKQAQSSARPGQHLKDEPVQPKINSESWKKYHTAWQDYYQKYYSNYYSNAAREYIAKEKLKEAREKAEEEEIAAHEINQDNQLRIKIRKKATDNAKKSRRMLFLCFNLLLSSSLFLLLKLFLLVSFFDDLLFVNSSFIVLVFVC